MRPWGQSRTDHVCARPHTTAAPAHHCTVSQTTALAGRFGVAHLVDVGGHGRHARVPKIKGRDRVAELLHPRQHEAAKAAVDVHGQALFERESGQFWDGVDHLQDREMRARAPSAFRDHDQPRPRDATAVTCGRGRTP